MKPRARIWTPRGDKKYGPRQASIVVFHQTHMHDGDAPNSVKPTFTSSGIAGFLMTYTHPTIATPSPESDYVLAHGMGNTQAGPSRDSVRWSSPLSAVRVPMRFALALR